MQIHHYHPVTLEYLGTSQADESPLEPGVFLIPAHATETAPPAEVAGKVRAFVGGAWTLQDAPPALPPDQPPTPAQIKDAQWVSIKYERDRRTQSGGYPAAGKWFHSDTFSRTQQLGLVMLGANIPAGTLWKTMDGSFVAMTQTLASQVFQSAAAQDAATFAAAEAHKAAMEAASDPAAYDFSTGWPPIFGE